MLQSLHFEVRELKPKLPHFLGCPGPAHFCLLQSGGGGHGMDGTLDRWVGHPTSPFDFLPVCTGVQLHQGLLWLLRLTAHNWKPQTAGPRAWGSQLTWGQRWKSGQEPTCSQQGWNWQPQPHTRAPGPLDGAQSMRQCWQQRWGTQNSLWGPDTLAAQRTVSSVVRKESTGNKNHREVSALGWAGLSGGAAGPQQGSPRTTHHTEK